MNYVNNVKKDTTLWQRAHIVKRTIYVYTHIHRQVGADKYLARPGRK